MAVSVTLGHEHLNGLTEQVNPIIAEKPFGLSIHEGDAALGVNHEHRAGRSFDNQTKTFFNSLDVKRQPCF